MPSLDLLDTTRNVTWIKLTTSIKQGSEFVKANMKTYKQICRVLTLQVEKPRWAYLKTLLLHDLSVNVIEEQQESIQQIVDLWYDNILTHYVDNDKSFDLALFQEHAIYLSPWIIKHALDWKTDYNSFINLLVDTQIVSKSMSFSALFSPFFKPLQQLLESDNYSFMKYRRKSSDMNCIKPCEILDNNSLMTQFVSKCKSFIFGGHFEVDMFNKVNFKTFLVNSQYLPRMIVNLEPILVKQLQSKAQKLIVKEVEKFVFTFTIAILYTISLCEFNIDISTKHYH